MNEYVMEAFVKNLTELEDFCKENKPVAAILCIPMVAAEKMVDLLIKKIGLKFHEDKDIKKNNNLNYEYFITSFQKIDPT